MLAATFVLMSVMPSVNTVLRTSFVKLQSSEIANVDSNTLSNLGTVGSTIECSCMCSSKSDCGGFYFNDTDGSCWSENTDQTAANTVSFYKAEVASTPCKDGWTVYNGSCYLVHNDLLNFADAKSFCNERGAHLINIGDGDEDDFIKGVLSTSSPGNWFWLGLSDEVTEGVWEWEGTGMVATFTDWRLGEPDEGSSGNCAVMYRSDSFQWHDSRCSNAARPICEHRA